MLASNDSKTQPIHGTSVSYVDPILTAESQFRKLFPGFSEISQEPRLVAASLSHWLACLGAVDMLNIIEFRRGTDEGFSVTAPAAKEHVSLSIGIKPIYRVSESEKTLLAIELNGAISSANPDSPIGMVAMQMKYTTEGQAHIVQARMINKADGKVKHITIVQTGADEFTMKTQTPGVTSPEIIDTMTGFVSGGRNTIPNKMSAEFAIREIQQSAKAMLVHS